MEEEPRGCPKAAMAFAITGISDDSLRQRFNLIRDRVEATLLPDEQVCVAGVPPRRTLKLLTALAKGHWVVSEAYIGACSRARSALDPGPFELHQELPGCRASRLIGGGSILAGYEVSIRGPTIIPRQELAELLRHAGASVRVGRDFGCIEVHATASRRKIEHADEGWQIGRASCRERV